MTRSVLSNGLMETRLKPWVSKLVEYFDAMHLNTLIWLRYTMFENLRTLISGNSEVANIQLSTLEYKQRSRLSSIFWRRETSARHRLTNYRIVLTFRLWSCSSGSSQGSSRFRFQHFLLFYRPSSRHFVSSTGHRQFFDWPSLFRLYNKAAFATSRDATIFILERNKPILPFAGTMRTSSLLLLMLILIPLVSPLGKLPEDVVDSEETLTSSDSQLESVEESEDTEDVTAQEGPEPPAVIAAQLEPLPAMSAPLARPPGEWMLLLSLLIHNFTFPHSYDNSWKVPNTNTSCFQDSVPRHSSNRQRAPESIQNKPMWGWVWNSIQVHITANLIPSRVFSTKVQSFPRLPPHFFSSSFVVAVPKWWASRDGKPTNYSPISTRCCCK